MGDMTPPRPDAIEQLGFVLEVQRDMGRTMAVLLEAVQALLDGALVGRDAALLNAIYDAMDNREFTSQELLNRCNWPDEAAPRLAGQLDGVGVRNLGIRLGKLVGQHTAAGLTLQRAPCARGPAVWRVLGG